MSTIAADSDDVDREGQVPGASGTSRRGVKEDRLRITPTRIGAGQAVPFASTHAGQGRAWRWPIRTRMKEASRPLSDPRLTVAPPRPARARDLRRRASRCWCCRPSRRVAAVAPARVRGPFAEERRQGRGRPGTLQAGREEEARRSHRVRARARAPEGILEGSARSVRPRRPGRDSPSLHRRRGREMRATPGRMPQAIGRSRPTPSLLR